MKIGPLGHKKTIKEILHQYNVAQCKIHQLLLHHCCYRNGEAIEPDTLFFINDYLSIDISLFEQMNYLPEDGQLPILYEDDYLLVVNKPARMIIYPDQPNKMGTVVNLVAQYYQDNQLDLTIRHCHRLDKDTTGCLIFAKDLITQSAMAHLFETHQVKKTYWTKVEGKITQAGRIELPIGKNRHSSGKMVVSPTGKKAITYYKPLSSTKQSTLVEIQIETGRTHQIRLHMATIGHPIIGDMLYGSTMDAPLLLHCKSLQWQHPITHERLVIDAPLPSTFQKYKK
ncbi:MAG: RluA family pseudouridine synthase [Staphylococcus sp.]|nr:RluA family pseudouridine synthase [Staphylococcus sp.]